MSRTNALFSSAARTLRLSQPSVSQQIALLETEIGVRLFDRARGGLRLTRAGEVLLQHADHIARRLELATRQLAGLSAERAARGADRRVPHALAGFVPEAIAREGRAAVIAQDRIGRMGRPEEIAAAVLWRCSAEAAFTIRDAMVVDGGQTA